MIRKADAGDIEPVAGIYGRVHDEEEASRTSTGWIRSVYPVRKTAEDALVRGDLYVMEEGGEIVASAVINRLQMPEYRFAAWQYAAQDREVLVLHTLTVDPVRGRRGYGTAFVRFYEALAGQLGCKVLRMDTNARNTAARRLYRKLGYAERGIVPCAFNGIPGVQLVCLEKPVGQDAIKMGIKGE